MRGGRGGFRGGFGARALSARNNSSMFHGHSVNSQDFIEIEPSKEIEVIVRSTVIHPKGRQKVKLPHANPELADSN